MEPTSPSNRILHSPIYIIIIYTGDLNYIHGVWKAELPLLDETMAMLLLAVYLYHELSLSEESQRKHFFEVMQQFSVVQSLKCLEL